MKHLRRSFFLDLLRILACLMIVVMHAPMPTGEENSLFLSSLSYLTAPGIGLFFMLSGALLLPVKTDVKAFLKKRIHKIALPLLFWTGVYLFFRFWLHDEPVTWRTILSIPFSAQGNPVFWFLYTLLGLYLIAPILSRWVEKASCTELEFYLMIWAISLCYPLLRLFVEINASSTGILYYLSGYAGYFVLGYYLKTYPKRIHIKGIFPLVLIAYCAPVVCKLAGLHVDFYSVFWYLSIFVAIQSVFLWKLVFFLTPNHKDLAPSSLIARLSRLTFGVYLIHYFIIRELLWNWTLIQEIRPYFLQTSVIILLAIIGSFAISGLIAHLRGARFLIGVEIPFRKPRGSS